MPQPDHTKAYRRLGRAASLAVFLLGVVYAVTLTLGLLSLESPQEPIRNPFFSIMELLIVVMAPVLVVAMVAVHGYASRDDKTHSLTALVLMTLCAGITSGVHFVILTVSRRSEFADLPWLPLFVSFKWPSVAYALDILAWDVFFGLSMIFAALVFKGGRLETAVRILMLITGILSVAGLIGVPLANMQVRLIGVLGYAGVSPIAFLLLAYVFGRSHP